MAHEYTEREIDFLHRRAGQFQGQLDRYTIGELDGERFQQLRLRHGLYKQRHAHMLRVAIPYGQLNSDQLKTLAHVARTYDRGFGHFTTRQNIQFNWPELEDVPRILHDLAGVGLHSIQTSGSCVRNITTDHLAGAAADEQEDPRPWCELLRQWSTLHPEFNWLPRKFKIAITGAESDRAAILYHDIGIRIERKPDETDPSFQIYVGGGMGRTPVIGKLLRSDLSPWELPGYIEAIMRVYNQFGRRDNKYKSRIKILVNDIGIHEFGNRVDKIWSQFRQQAPRFSAEQIAVAKASFNPPGKRYEFTENGVIPVTSPAFQTWKKVNTSNHKVQGLTVVHLSLKAPGETPGDMDADTMETLAHLSHRYSAGEIRVTHEQNLILPWVRTADLYGLWQALERLRLATPNIGKLTDMIVCPGLDFCSLANASTIPLARQIGLRMQDLDKQFQVGDIKIKMSGCMNACGHHHAGDIGILGVDKKGKEWYQLTLGGKAGNDATIGKRLGPAVSREQLANAIEIIIDTYLDIRTEEESFAQTVSRAGISPFKENLYASITESSTEIRSVAA